MNVIINSISNSTISSFFREKIQLSLLQKRIITITSIAFGFLAASYIFTRLCRIKEGFGTNISYFGMKLEKGNFKEGLLEDKGKVWILFGFIVKEGQFKNGHLHGQGKITLIGRTIAEGEFKNNLLNGLGKQMFYDGRIYEGQFKNGKLDGPGKRTFPYGIIEEGKFENGIFVS
jgi:hypothetical protein